MYALTCLIVLSYFVFSYSEAATLREQQDHISRRRNERSQGLRFKPFNDWRNHLRYEVPSRRRYLGGYDALVSRGNEYLDQVPPKTRRRHHKKHIAKRRKHHHRRDLNKMTFNDEFSNSRRYYPRNFYNDYAENPLFNRRSYYRYNPTATGTILGSPTMPNHLPEAEAILPGHTLIRPAMGMLKSAVKFPHRELESGSGVNGNWNNIGIKYDGRNERVLYTGFRRTNTPSRKPLHDFITLGVPSQYQLGPKSSYENLVANDVLDMDKKGNDPTIKYLLNNMKNPVKRENKLILYLDDSAENRVSLNDLLNDDKEFQGRLGGFDDRQSINFFPDKHIKLRRNENQAANLRSVGDWFEEIWWKTKHWFGSAWDDTMGKFGKWVLGLFVSKDDLAKIKDATASASSSGTRLGSYQIPIETLYNKYLQSLEH